MEEKREIKISFFDKVDKFGDMFCLNLLFVISCIPIITIGAAITALYSYSLKMVKNEESGVWKGYWKAFKDNFKPATKVWIVLLLFAALLYGEFFLSFCVTGLALSVVLAIMAIEAIYLSFVIPVIFPLIARYENTTRNYFRNSFLISISHLGSWCYMFFIWALPIALYATNEKILFYSWFLWVLILISILAYATSMIALRLFAKLENKDDEDAEETEDQNDSKKNNSKNNNNKNSKKNSNNKNNNSSNKNKNKYNNSNSNYKNKNNNKTNNKTNKSAKSN